MTLKNLRINDYPLWYQEVITAADMAENSASPGCMVIKPWGYGIWELIQKALDKKIKDTGHENCYFPLYIPLSFFAKEAEHVEGFAKEMAIVTHSRLSLQDGKLVPQGKLEEPLVVRPTSETIIADSFAKWIKSYRDLPLKINQWANVSRWEMRPRMFLRTREFLWQEGHTAHSTPSEAIDETFTMLDVYKDLAEDFIAMPVIKGKKPEHEKFPGAVDTYCIEAMMQDGKALQAGTSHFLGQNFAKSGGISFQNSSGEQEYAYTTSWGVSTRLIGALIMTHGDDEGLKVPPKLAPYQVVIVPLIHDEANEMKILSYIDKITSELSQKAAFGEPIRVKVDMRDKKSADKYWEWTKKGAPIILEIGIKDIESGKIMAKIRNKIGTPEHKKIIEFSEFINTAENMLKDIQNQMFEAAKAYLNKNITSEIKDFKDFRAYFSKKAGFVVGEETSSPGFVLGKWCGDAATLPLLKEMQITVRCLPLDKQDGTEAPCLITGKPSKMNVIFARAY